MNILLTVDARMISPMAACLRSLALSNGHDDLVVYIIHGDLGSYEEMRLRNFCSELGLETRFIPVSGNKFQDLRASMPSGHVSDAGLFRIDVANFLPDSVERVLYLDCDTLVLGSLTSLYQCDIGEKIVMSHRVAREHLTDLGVTREDYFNSGVMLIDLLNWRKAGIGEKAFSVIEEHSDRLIWWDQCALNIALVGQTHDMNLKYNYVFNPDHMYGDFSFPVILHFAGSEKPWVFPLSHPWGGIYLEMSNRTPWPAPIASTATKKVSWFRKQRRQLMTQLGLRK